MNNGINDDKLPTSGFSLDFSSRSSLCQCQKSPQKNLLHVLHLWLRWRRQTVAVTIAVHVSGNPKTRKTSGGGLRRLRCFLSWNFRGVTGWCSTPTLLLICSSFSRENGHPLLICSSLSTAQVKILDQKKFNQRGLSWNDERGNHQKSRVPF